MIKQITMAVFFLGITNSAFSASLLPDQASSNREARDPAGIKLKQISDMIDKLRGKKQAEARKSFEAIDLSEEAEKMRAKSFFIARKAIKELESIVKDGYVCVGVFGALSRAYEILGGEENIRKAEEYTVLMQEEIKKQDEAKDQVLKELNISKNEFEKLVVDHLKATGGKLKFELY